MAKRAAYHQKPNDQDRRNQPNRRHPKVDTDNCSKTGNSAENPDKDDGLPWAQATRQEPMVQVASVTCIEAAVCQLAPHQCGD